jgi:hypothetical protein
MQLTYNVYFAVAYYICSHLTTTSTSCFSAAVEGREREIFLIRPPPLIVNECGGRGSARFEIRHLFG